MLLIASVLATAALGIGLRAHATDRPWRSLIFLILTAVQLGVALGLRSRLFTKQNPYLPLTVAGSLLLALAGIYLPVLQEILGTDSLSAVDALMGACCAAIGWAPHVSPAAANTDRCH